jgi:hypothetical protein
VNYIVAEGGAGSSGGSIAATAQGKVDDMFADV